MDIVLYTIVGVVCFFAGRTSAPKEVVKQLEMTDKERKEFDYLKALNQSLLTEVQQYRSIEKNLGEEIWQLKQKLKKSQLKN